MGFYWRWASIRDNTVIRNFN